MKPNFALSLSFDGIRLLHRAAGGWHLVGEVAITDPDLAGALAGLLAQGKALIKRKLRTKLIIPDDQIKYLTIDTPGMDDAARRAAARIALDGATPYAVDALAFDISPDGARTHVAAVARETLLEAEAFASEHGFHPVSFVAAAEGSDFLGEPFFGPTAHSRAILASGAQVEPDGVRVVIVEKPVEDDTPPAVVVTEPTPDAPAELVEPEAAEPALSETPPEAAATPPQVETEAAQPVPAPTSVQATDEPPAPADTAQPSAPAPLPEAEADSAAPAKAPAPPDAKSPPPADVTDNEAQTPDHDPEADVTTPPLLGFATRRRQDPASTAAPARLGGVSRDAPVARTTPPVSLDKTAPPPKAAPAINLATPPKSVSDSLRPTLGTVGAEPAGTPAAAQITAKPAARMGGFLSRRKPTTTSGDSAATRNRTAKGGTKTDGETERMTVFGAREGRVVGGKPRFLGLILMAILLVFLAGVAAWATVFMDEGLSKLFQGRERTLASTLPDDARDTLAEDVGATTELPLDDEAIADGVVVAALNDSLSDDGLSAEDAAVLDALRDPLPDPVAPEDLDAADLEARYAVTGIWSKAPEMVPPADVIDIEDLYITSIDPISPALDAVALPPLRSLETDTRPDLVTSPVAAGTSFARSADGRVIATIEGALSPDGFTVFLGRPPAVPPATLARLNVEEEVNPDLSALAQARPRTRPEDLIEQNERATLGGLSRSELASLRPRLRPQGAQERLAEQAAEEAAAQAAEQAAIDAAVEDAIDETVVEEQTPASPLAAVASLRPETRPRNFARTVARAQPAEPAEPADPAPQRSASVAPRTVAPSIPSSASVTREATVRDAINLRRINLIGVFGTPSNRRALVRLSNGRYQRVEVGDRIDGGRVSAIGDSELRYQKGNRNLILQMPQG